MIPGLCRLDYCNSSSSSSSENGAVDAWPSRCRRPPTSRRSPSAPGEAGVHLEDGRALWGNMKRRKNDDDER